MPFDVKKEEKALYLPKTEPGLIDVPRMRFLCVDGEGDPNSPAFSRAVETLYALSYAIRMSDKKGNSPAGFFEYVVPPLEGLWWVEDGGFDFLARDNWRWTAMIRQMEFVDEACLETARCTVHKKKPDLDVSAAYLRDFTEGLCVQIMHIGPFADEPASVEKMRAFLVREGYADETGSERKHHEIYLNDPRKSNSAAIKTVLRHPVRKGGSSHA